MQKNSLKTLIITVFSLILIISSCKIRESRLTIATAANMQFAMNALVDAYEAETGADCEIILGSSGKLTAQIEQGAPYDLFFSADTKFPEALQASGNTIGDPVVYAQGQLVLWSIRDDTPVSIDLLNSPEVSYIAIANPKTAPYGLAAEEVLNKLGVYSEIKDKLVFGESISQVNQFIFTEAAEIGFTAKSVVLSPNMSGRGNWITIADSLHSPINQAMVILKNDRGLGKEAEALATFVRSEKGLSILRNFGYR